MEDLVRWLGAQLDTDERTARDQLCVNCGNGISPLRSPIGITGYTHEGVRLDERGELTRGWEGRRCPGMLLGAEPVQNPARVLREIDSKRRIVDDYERASAEYAADGMAYDYESETGRARTAVLEGVVRLLALPYADRDGYQESWRP